MQKWFFKWDIPLILPTNNKMREGLMAESRRFPVRHMALRNDKKPNKYSFGKRKANGSF